MPIKIKSPQAPNVGLSAKKMKEIVKKEENIFMARQDAVDESKTKKSINDDGTILYTYYDKNGKELYTRCDTPDGSGWHATSIYAMRDEDGNVVRYIDEGKDGTIERMDYLENRNGFLANLFQAFDTNKDGEFDEGMPNSGANAGKHLDLET